MIAGRYTLDREIGRGGMGAVWLGRDVTLDREVALKRIGVAPGSQTPDVRRAEREARLAAMVNHRHVVGVYDMVEHDHQQWLVMEYIDGRSLSQLIKENGPLDPAFVASALAQVADALAAAHAAGVVHRDVKPSNILVTDAGIAKLTDFGIARSSTDDNQLTQTGLVSGSPAYLAPEVATGKPATAASDVWGLGATLYHALAGQAPYAVGENVMGVLYQIVHEDPPRLPEAGWLGDLLSHTMTQRPNERWAMAVVGTYLRQGPEGVRRLGMTVGETTQLQPAEPARTTRTRSERTRSEESPATPAPSTTSGPTRRRRSAPAPTPQPTRRGLSPFTWVLLVLTGLLIALVTLAAWTLGRGVAAEQPGQPERPGTTVVQAEGPSTGSDGPPAEL